MIAVWWRACCVSLNDVGMLPIHKQLTRKAGACRRCGGTRVVSAGKHMCCLLQAVHDVGTGMLPTHKQLTSNVGARRPALLHCKK